MSGPPSGFATCEYLSSGDFAFGSGWTLTYEEMASWSVDGGVLDVQEIDPWIAVTALHDFFPPDFFSVDTDISIVSSTDQDDRVGILISTVGGSFYDVNDGSSQVTVDTIVCYYYPATGLFEFKVYDALARDWVTPLGAHASSGSVDSIGFSMVADGIIFRINGQDTDYKLAGDFSAGPYSIVDTLGLRAGGVGLHARFDNICASAYEAAVIPAAVRRRRRHASAQQPGGGYYNDSVGRPGDQY